MVKEDAPALLRKELSSKKWKPQLLAMSGVTDCYQPIERRLQLTRKCLAVLADFRNPVGIITKNHLVTRDIDLLQELARHNAVGVNVSINSIVAASPIGSRRGAGQSWNSRRCAGCADHSGIE
jgi:DNA repair photolyase